MSTRSDRFYFDTAKPEDGEQLLKIYESMDFKGKISVLFTRRPDPYQSLMEEGERVLIPVIRAKETGKICAMGCLVIRKVYINGEIKKAGYLTALKVLPQYRNRLPHIAKVYEFIYENTREEVDLYYTTILKENTLAQKILEKKRKNMPEYQYHGEYTVYFFGAGKGRKQNKKPFGKDPYIFEKNNFQGVSTFYEQVEKQYDFSAVKSWGEYKDEKTVYTLRTQNGDILAVCQLWNQQKRKQYIISGYQGIYRLLQHIPFSWLGYPSFPKENTIIQEVSLAGFYVKENKREVAKRLLENIVEDAKGVDILMLGLFEHHPLMPIFESMKHIKYQSRLYTVHWEGSKKFDLKKTIHLEVGML